MRLYEKPEKRKIIKGGRILTFEEYEEENNHFKDFEYTDEDVEAIMDNVKNVKYINTVDVDWDEVEMDRVHYHISKQKAKGKYRSESSKKAKGQLKRLYEDVKYIFKK